MQGTYSKSNVYDLGENKFIIYSHGRASRAPEGASPAVFVPSLHTFFKELFSNLTNTIFVDFFLFWFCGISGANLVFRLVLLRVETASST